MTDLRFVPLTQEHAAALDAVVRDPDVLRFTRVPDPPPAGFGSEWIARYEASREGDRAREAWAVLDPDDAFVALALAPRIDHDAAEAELGYLVAPGARGRGLATATLRWLTDWAHDEAGIVRAYLVIDVDNVPSQHVARRCGYTFEGVARSTYLKPGRRADVGIWSHLPGDPRPGRG